MEEPGCPDCCPCGNKIRAKCWIWFGSNEAISSLRATGLMFAAAGLFLMFASPSRRAAILGLTAEVLGAGAGGGPGGVEVLA